MKLCFKFYPKLSQLQTDIINELSFHTTKLYNMANYECKENSFKPYVELEKMFKNNWHNGFLHSHNYQQCLKIVEQDWKAFFTADKDFSVHPKKHKGKPRSPKYKNTDNRKNQVIYTQFSIRIKGNILMLSLSKQMQSMFNVKSLNFELPEKVQKHINIDTIQQAKINYDNNLKQWYLIIIYNVQEINKADGNNIMSIDLGLDNLCAITFKDNIDQILVNGRTLKSKNSYFNRQIAKYTGISMKQSHSSTKFKRTKKLKKLQLKRNNYINNYLHHVSRYIIDLAIEKHCNKILIGNIKNIKQKNKSKSFVQIPEQRLVDLITYKAKLEGIKVIFVNESYTSGVSAIDMEPIKKQYYNKKRRIERGLFKTNTGLVINADINGSLNILRKYVKNVIPMLIQELRNNGCWNQPIRIRVAC